MLLLSHQLDSSSINSPHLPSVHLQLSPCSSIFLTSFVVGLRVKPSLTSLWLNRSARWIPSQFESRRLNVLCLFATPNRLTCCRLARFPSLYFDFMSRLAIVVSLRLKLSLTLLWLNRFAKWFRCSSLQLFAVLYVLIRCDSSQINRSHFTIKSVLTPLLLNKYARWLQRTSTFLNVSHRIVLLIAFFRLITA